MTTKFPGVPTAPVPPMPTLPSSQSNLRFPSSADIIQRIEAVCKKQAPGEASIAICEAGERRRFTIDSSGAVTEAQGTDTLKVPTTCMSKLHTATLAIEQFAERGVSIDQDVAELARDLFGVEPIGLEGVTIRHLLNSTHGLDDAEVGPYPRRSDGCLDFEGLLRRYAEVPRIIESGVCFSLSDNGMALVGSILERLDGRRYGEILAKHLLPTLASEAGQSGAIESVDGHWCPTTGGALTRSASDLLALASHFFLADGRVNANASKLLETMRANPAGFPGWTGMGHAVGLGWHLYGGGWIGYSGAISNDGGSQFLRMRPENGTAIAIVSRKIAAHYLAISVFGEYLPEVKDSRPPRILLRDEGGADAVSAEDLVGRFEVGPVAAEFTQTDATTFRVVINNRFSDDQFVPKPIECGLRMAHERGFFTVPVNGSFLSFGQIVEPQTPNGTRRYLWNGRRLWRKVR